MRLMFNQKPPKPGLPQIPAGIAPAPAGGTVFPDGIGPNQGGEQLGKSLGVLDDRRGGGKEPAKR